ncbi:Pancreatic alpha-amylase [Holothuria leucospilota]|uniref:Alpha-amylase n=1 Tax=Holothuria leucospilota TaxID=206669 RepID=A0A9Q1HDG5_HOLLE|nr:Pancreatic alpha-amylase [Holothuria leucospilota]
MRIVFLALILGLARAQFDTNAEGNRGTIVNLFSWRWTDIAKECERFLGPKGYAGVQISPPNDHSIVRAPDRPWWERYQVAGYDLVSRSGYDADDFTDMVEKCNDYDVRIYVDAVFNHMAYFGEAAISNTPFSPEDLEYPSVPYTEVDFNSHYAGLCDDPNNDLDDPSSAQEQRNCNILALKDLALHLPEVRGKVAAYLNKMIDIGVAGFRVDFAEHMWPEDLENIYGQLHDLKSDVFGQGVRPFIYQEVRDTGDGPIRATEYTDLGRVTEFNYGPLIANAIRRVTPLANLRDQLGSSSQLLPSDKSLIFIDSHYTQRADEWKDKVLTFDEGRNYRLGTTFMLAWPYSVTRVMSSYRFNDYDDGPPSNSYGDILSPQIGSNEMCSGQYVCEHRWRAIKNMVAFQNAVRGESITNWWDNGNQQVAFGRGNKGFVVINNELNQDLTETLQTGLPKAEYCNVILGDIERGQCSGPTVDVRSDGTADFVIGSSGDSMVVIYVDAIVTDGGSATNISLIVLVLAFFVSLII